MSRWGLRVDQKERLEALAELRRLAMDLTNELYRQYPDESMRFYDVVYKATRRLERVLAKEESDE